MHIKEIRLQTAMMQELDVFYRTTLEIPTILYNDVLQVFAWTSKIVFTKANSIVAPYYHFAFNIPSNKIQDAYEWLSKRVQPLWMEDYNSYIADFSNWHAQSIYFSDPAGNIVEFIARFDRNDNSSEPFNHELLRNISEIGIVFPAASFDHEVNKFLTSYPVSYFSKQAFLKEFRAIGDDEGLFICVPEQRNWFPTKEKPARIFPIEVLFQVGDKEFLLRG